MPKKVEKALKKGAKKAGLKGKAADKYVFGAMNNMGMMKGNKAVPEESLPFPPKKRKK